jgi:hypothetical protein
LRWDGQSARSLLAAQQHEKRALGMHTIKVIDPLQARDQLGELLGASLSSDSPPRWFCVGTIDATTLCSLRSSTKNALVPDATVALLGSRLTADYPD